MLLLLYAIFKELIAKNDLERVMGSIHEELLIEVPEEQAEEHAKLPRLESFDRTILRILNLSISPLQSQSCLP
jgi:hypothetical protein